VSHTGQFWEAFSALRKPSLNEHLDSMMEQISTDERALGVHRKPCRCVVLAAAAHEQVGVRIIAHIVGALRP
jgi:hypothetical protein